MEGASEKDWEEGSFESQSSSAVPLAFDRCALELAAVVVQVGTQVYLGGEEGILALDGGIVLEGLVDRKEVLRLEEEDIFRLPVVSIGWSTVS